MPAHLLAFSGSLAAVATYQQINAVPDQLYTRQNNEFQVPKRAVVAWYAAQGTNLLAARLFTASLRLRGNPQVVPFDAAAWDTSFPAYTDCTDDPLLLIEEENLRAESLHTAAGPDLNRLFVSVQQTPFNQNINYKGGRWVRGTALITTVAESWSSLGSITFDDVLEGGTYAVYGMVVMEPSLFAARLVFQNQYERPGSLALAAGPNSPMYISWMRSQGLLGVFDTYSTPQLEGFSSAAAAVTANVFLYIAKADGFQPPFRGQMGV